MQRKTLSVALAAILVAGATGTALSAAAGKPTVIRADTGATAGNSDGYDRFIVKYRDGSAAKADATQLTRAIDAVAARAVTARAGMAAPRARHLRRLAGSGADLVRLSRRLDRVEAENLMRSIAADPAVEYVVPDRLRQATAAPNDPYYTTHQWHFNHPVGGAGVQTAWDANATGAGVVVAVLDTGVTEHPDLAANLLPGYDFIFDHEVSGRDSDGRVAGGADTGDWVAANQCFNGSQKRDSSWHGSHVSGTIAEVTGNGVGMAGVARDARIVPVRVLGHCGGYDSDINDAIVWASGGHVDGVPDNPYPAEVINMSLGGSGSCDAPTQAAIDSAVSRGTTIVVAAGNDNGDVSSHSPANCQNVITVGSSGISGRRASYSNYGARIDIAAPGGGINDGASQVEGYIWSTVNMGTTVPTVAGYGGMVGTSMAAPHVAGVAAIVQSALDSPKTPGELAALLKQTARPFPTTPDRPLGTGIVDAGAAVIVARTGGQPLSNGIAKTGLRGNANDGYVYVFPVTAGTARLNVITYGGTGQVKLLVKNGSEPTTTSYDAISQRPGNNQTITLNAPAAGAYYVKVLGVSSFSGVSVKASTM
ncbi:S8 family serine peptidase [Lysobacter sp. S4-A87]|uniref:S8 family peptidase n=1 Tax=Lysobacter sp. S4-A87 TaxID=2925843 RepID=UPI001F52BC2D|nr:S8 family peptidase [Lysobacter sp. S4-A87]UNK49118.1 S8 family serine peptidase [Lysobacter sp. S4-A87]